MILSVKNLKKSYSDGSSTLEVLKDISFDLQKGSILTIKGPSGSGKSTLLSLLGTLDTQNSGDIIINNRNLNEYDDFSDIRNSHIGFIFQFHNLIPELNVTENICVPAFISNKVIDHNFLDTLFEYFELTNKENAFPLDLSGGEKQRVSVMRAVINKPSIIIADEPTGNLDEKNALKLIDLFKKLNEDFGLTFIIATHDNKVFDIGHQKMELSDGKLLKL